MQTEKEIKIFILKANPILFNKMCTQLERTHKSEIKSCDNN